MNRLTTKGFTLVELLVALAIISIIMTVAVPGYQGYIARTNRSDATIALMRVAAAQERFYLQHGTYAADLGTRPDGLGISGTQRGYYNLSIIAHDKGLSTGYTVMAKAGNGSQHDDTDCASFTLNQNGERGSAPKPLETCWR
jgi:type IV pilus assembly protein PilE